VAALLTGCADPECNFPAARLATAQDRTLDVPTVADLARAARKVLTVDGCHNQCVRKIVEAAGIKISRGIVVSRDANVEKHTFRSDVGGNAKPVMEYIHDADVDRTKKLIVNAVREV